MTPTSTQNLNSKLSPRRAANESTGTVGISWSASAIRSSAAPVRIVGGTSRYRGGGYCVNC